ncbi:sulfurtransferase TusA family protein [Vallitalea okinawensis]|uniref:sulfurtransferase TusA family protein n=1 Tax=Vallitalea okinawensis TaxID=2078660 RepID=UPI000CFD0860|nr:sulfurtransferase TusA family protein [Vallitalea okinawensis]
MKKIDCLGDFCPIPVIKAKDAFKKLSPNESFMIITDHSCVVESLSAQFSKFNCIIETDEVINGVWEITVTRL